MRKLSVPLTFWSAVVGVSVPELPLKMSRNIGSSVYNI